MAGILYPHNEEAYQSAAAMPAVYGKAAKFPEEIIKAPARGPKASARYLFMFSKKVLHQYPYRFRYFSSSAAAITVPSSSATGVASHTPVTPPSRTGMS